MAILSEQSLDFAREHISKYYDSDFFPKPIEYEALWYHWEDVKKELMSKNIAKLWVTQPRAMTIAKPKGGFRIVHQLEPIDSVIYTALACEVTEAVEKARIPSEEHIACSYRLQISDGNFFGAGSGWVDFTQKTEELADQYSTVLITDITDFYNQIYLHRLNNAIEIADSTLKPLGDDIETFLSTQNSKSSQGIPVGPAASIIMAEAVFIDIDRFLKDQGVHHTRYVDDIRIFSNSTRELSRVLESLTLYLYENHRLTVSTEKTFIMNSKEFIEKHLHNHYAEEKIQLLETLEIFNAYTNEMEEVEIEIEDEELILEIRLLAAIEKIVTYDHLDLGLARSIIRSARRNKHQNIAATILSNFDFFAPVINDVALYLHEVTDDYFSKHFLSAIEEVIEKPAVDSQICRFWLEWYIAQNPNLLKSPALHSFIFNGPNIENQALAAITNKNVAWVRNHKATVYNLGGKARRAVLNSSRVLPSDERTHWLKLFISNSPVLLDRLVAQWVQKTA
ncbi:RNA-directed DNA polymerase [Pseudomonas rubra]|uniref:RNA-directed DNA polymerase n=1 Tax=Pseudomonas rubra TaxID=2942627 RepID=A0ABT5P7P9_9PSED|nr:RNA-directed DNA polymerase [Pseudomonas rubra]MDD1014323.1 RNA-directed DNA polymerase [Pseudomonas rubra]MDD1038054.1 RNA-directed DNA polymerase [Pseudomonas rubra]MDD1155487.1 RNA-directed DNA polymerase [Pseudomonas rubra]